MSPEERKKYYIQVVKAGEKVEWPRPEEELVIGSQDLPGGYTQFFAYHLDSGKSAEDLPPAEVVASENTTPKPAILIDQPHPMVGDSDSEVLELILVQDGHAYANTSSSFSALEKNVNEILQIAKDQFDMEVEHFMTTDRVSEEVEERLDKLEDGENEQKVDEDLKLEPGIKEPEEKEQIIEKAVIESPGIQANVQNLDLGPESGMTETEPSIPHVAHHLNPNASFNRPRTNYTLDDTSSSSKKWVLIPVILLLVLFSGAIYFRETLFQGLQNSSIISTPTPTPTPIPEPTPTPMPKVERSEFKVRVLNGTTISGAAGALADKLKELGWEVVKVGNNSDQAVTEGFIRAKQGQETAVEVLRNDLGSGFEGSSSSSLKTSDTADIEVVIGKE